ncbi:MAG: BrnT family toxin [Nitrospinae bacterium]|nr:BrnT family toxin [Nitrospinota bacterium]
MIKIKTLGFDWDAGNRSKCRKHGLAPLEIEGFFKQESVYIAPDFKHSQKEIRYLAAGRSEKGRPMFVAFALRKNNGDLLIRPISARYMHKKEARKHEEESS